MAVEQQIVKDEPTRERLIERIRGLSLEKPWAFKWGLWRKHRTLSQMGLVHQWFDEVGKATGNHPEDVKHGYKDLFLTRVEKTWRGKTRLALPSLNDLNTLEMSDFMNQVQADALTMGIPLTEPLEMQKR